MQSLILHCDNVSVGLLVKNPVLHSRMKHMKIGFYFFREKVQAEENVVQYVPREEQVANIMAKALPTTQLQNLSIKLTILEKP